MGVHLEVKHLYVKTTYIIYKISKLCWDFWASNLSLLRATHR